MDENTFSGAYARNTDPSTSHWAAKTVDVTYLEGVVLNAIKKYPTLGLTQDELVEVTGLPTNTITPRFATLLSKGLITAEGTRKGISGRNQRVHRGVAGIAVNIAPEPANSIVREIENRRQVREATERISRLKEAAAAATSEAEALAKRYNITL
jgi:hypothetical protein